MIIRNFATVLVGTVALAVCGCSSNSTSSVQAKGSEDSGAQAGQDFQELAGYDWTADPGEEKYWCGYKTLTEDLYISAFRPTLPQGTHHVVIGYTETPMQPDGTVPEGTNGCIGTTFGDIFAYAGTVGGNTVLMPEGVAVKIPSGSQIVFGLHVNNLGTSPLHGHSGVDVRSPDPSKVKNEAEVIAVSNFSLSIPPGKVTQTADCTMIADATVFSVMPHMHLMGRHMTTTTVTANGPGPTLLDADYTFTEQQYTELTPAVHLAQGDKIHVECDYENTSTNTLGFGENTSGKEMCITFAYRYPAVSMTLPANPGFARGTCVN